MITHSLIERVENGWSVTLALGQQPPRIYMFETLKECLQHVKGVEVEFKTGYQLSIQDAEQPKDPINLTEDDL